MEPIRHLKMVNYNEMLTLSGLLTCAAEPELEYGAKRNYSGNVIVNLTFQFALGIIKFSEQLREQKRFTLADQVLRAGCSIGANVREAQRAESKADFVHKLKVAIKEAEETEYWLDLCNFSENYPKSGKLSQEIVAIIKVINKIISTTKRKYAKG
jgi:four helix bundle protein